MTSVLPFDLDSELFAHLRSRKEVLGVDEGDIVEFVPKGVIIEDFGVERRARDVDIPNGRARLLAKLHVECIEVEGAMGAWPSVHGFFSTQNEAAYGSG